MFSSQALPSFMNNSLLQLSVEQRVNDGQISEKFGVEHGFNPPGHYRRIRLDTAESGYNTCCSNSESDGPVVNIENEVFKELQMHRQIPYRDYLCHRCFQKGHMIRQCPMRDPSPKTPYQGENISKGAFRCRCGRTWKSEYVVANKSYNCHMCQAPNFPMKMWKKYNNIHGKINRFHVPPPNYNNIPYQSTNFFYTYCS